MAVITLTVNIGRWCCGAAVATYSANVRVVSIKPSASGAVAGLRFNPSGLWSGRTRPEKPDPYGVSAIRIDPRDVVVGPAWIDSEGFDIIGRRSGLPGTEPMDFPRSCW
jgi:hypothetical protein